jgi:hypothetical protein
MNRLTGSLIGIAALTMAAGGAWADQDIEFDRYACNILILQDPEIQKELNIQPIQKFNMNKHADWFNAEQGKLETQVRTGQATQDMAKKQEGLLDQMKVKVMKELSKWQTGRLREISLQQAGPMALLDEKVAKKVSISDAQLEKIRKKYADNSKDAAKLEDAAFNPIVAKYKALKPKDQAEALKFQGEFEKEMSAAGKKIEPAVLKLSDSFQTFLDEAMTKDQQDKFKALLGKPFTPEQPTKKKVDGV